MNRRLFLLVIALLACLALPAGFVAAGSTPAALEPVPTPVTLTGVFTIISGDPVDMGAPGAAPVERFFLTDAGGATTELTVPADARPPEFYRLSGQQVIVTGASSSSVREGEVESETFTVASMHPTAARAADSPVRGSGPWLTIGCKFADVSAEPRTIDYFRQMYRDSYPGLDHYWQVASYGLLSLAGSDAVGWYTLPLPKNAYMIDANTLDWYKAGADCGALADPYVYFPTYGGVNFMFNDTIGCCAWGGGWIMRFDGVEKGYGVTWLPPWAYSNIAYVQHEMGHGYGMMHSASPSGVTYGNAWDVMAAPTYNCAVTQDTAYNCVGQLPIAYHLVWRGWIPWSRVYFANPNGNGSPAVHTVTLERTMRPTTNGYLAVFVPIEDDYDTHYLTIEVRRRLEYEANLPGDAVIIHDVASRGGDEARIVDPGGSSLGDSDRAMWLPGETFVYGPAGILIHVDAAGPTGATVTIVQGAPMRHMILNPTEDTYLDSTKPVVAFGAATGLKVRAGATRNETFLKFDAGQIPPTTTGVRLEMTLTNAVNAGNPGALFAVPPTFEGSPTYWTEETLTWANRPLFASSINATATRDGARVLWDVTADYSAQNRLGTLSVRPGKTTNVTYSSKEGPAAPALLIDYLVMPEQTETTTFLPTNDAYVLSSSPGGVFNRPVLNVKDAAADMNSYLKFNVQGLSGTVRSAKLRLYVKDAGPDGGAVYAVSPFYRNTTTQWLETGLKWSNAPVIGGTPLASIGPVTLNKWVEVDVTAAVRQGLASQNGRVSLAISNDSTNLVSYSSKEGARPPELVVVTAP